MASSIYTVMIYLLCKEKDSSYHHTYSIQEKIKASKESGNTAALH